MQVTRKILWDNYSYNCITYITIVEPIAKVLPDAGNSGKEEEEAAVVTGACACLGRGFSEPTFITGAEGGRKGGNM